MYFSDGTNGKILHNGKLICHSIQLPWKNNEKRVSCIPEGIYTLRKRYSRKFKAHIEITGVPERSFILFHSANNAMKELNGCIAPVTKIAGAGLGSQSRWAFEKLRTWVYTALDNNEKVILVIKSEKQKR